MKDNKSAVHVKKAIATVPLQKNEIEAAVDKLSPEEIQRQPQVVNNEVTDGEDG